MTGWAGWIAIVLLPLSFWAMLIAVLVVVFRSGPPIEVAAEAPVVEPVREPVREPARERSALGWLPPVAPHH
ncbi:MAG TPA: hypothetical protein VG076_11410 [Acidimicrobiales bacterium]|jgi:hypothetical protein|nr:hypothetical protein [Acidimicrobiales bacterium]